VAAEHTEKLMAQVEFGSVETMTHHAYCIGYCECYCVSILRICTRARAREVRPRRGLGHLPAAEHKCQVLDSL